MDPVTSSALITGAFMAIVALAKTYADHRRDIIVAKLTQGRPPSPEAADADPAEGFGGGGGGGCQCEGGGGGDNGGGGAPTSGRAIRGGGGDGGGDGSDSGGGAPTSGRALRRLALAHLTSAASDEGAPELLPRGRAPHTSSGHQLRGAHSGSSYFSVSNPLALPPPSFPAPRSRINSAIDYSSINQAQPAFIPVIDQHAFSRAPFYNNQAQPANYNIFSNPQHVLTSEPFTTINNNVFSPSSLASPRAAFFK